MVALFIGYFIVLLPSLYVDYKQDKNLESIKELQQDYCLERSYSNLKVLNPTGTITVEFPMAGNALIIKNNFMEAEVIIKDLELLEMLERLRQLSNDFTKEEFQFSEDEMNKYQDIIIDKLLGSQLAMDDYPISFHVEYSSEYQGLEELSHNTHLISENSFVLESNVGDGQTYYTSYIAITRLSDTVVVTLANMTTPSMDDIKPVIFRSLPMILAIVVLLCMLLSSAFAKYIVQPIRKVATMAEHIINTKKLKMKPIALGKKDEIAYLGETMREVYQRLEDNYQELETINSQLSEENKRQEVFLRATSHQLKTPIQAALLLTDGMIQEVGKYKDTKVYLPQLKGQILNMQHIVEEILSLHHNLNELSMEPVELSSLLQSILNRYDCQISERSLTVITNYEEVSIKSNHGMLEKIFDNIIANAIYYTPNNHKIHIRITKEEVCIFNAGTKIETELLPHIFEPFVTSNRKERGHGLGLYIVSYYSKLLGLTVTIENTKDGVMVRVKRDNKVSMCCEDK